MNHAPSTSADDAALADILDGLTARLHRGERVDESDICRQYPQFAVQLRDLFPALRMLGDLSKSRLDTLNGLMGTNTDPTVGMLGDFRILREIGRGGMGVVYEAEQITLGRRVALKVLPFAATMDPRQLQRFQNEVRAAASLHHEHIVPVYTVGVERGLHYFAMQFIDGKTLAEMIRELSHAQASEESTATHSTALRRGHTQTQVDRATTQHTKHDPQYYRNVAELGVQAALALEHAHTQGIVHRDVKPANLMIDAQGKLWVTDFGLAQVGGRNDLTATGDVIGTLRYMSPEQALAKHNLVDHRTDVYSLGVTLYELLTLSPAVTGQDRHELLHKIAFTDPPPPRSLASDLPREFETIILKAIAKDPHARYQSAEDLADDLRRYLDDQPIKARRTTKLQLLWRWRRRNPALAMSLLCLLVVIVIGNLLVAWKWNQARQARDDAQQSALQAKDRASALQRSEYFQRIARSDLEWWANNVHRADQELENCPVALRHWEWHYLKALCHSELRSLHGHQGRVRAVAYSPDGKYLASGGNDGSIRFWDITTSKQVRLLAGHTSHIWTIAFSPDGRYLASASGDWSEAIFGEIKIWDVLTGHEIATYPQTTGMIDTVVFSPDGLTLAAACWDTTIRLITPATGEIRTLSGHTGSCKAVVYSPDGKYLASGARDATIRVWDVSRGYSHVRTLPGHKADILALAYSPNGSTLVSSSWDNTVRLWKTTSWQSTALPGHTAPVDGIAFCPDGKQFASSSVDGTVRIWAADTGEEVSILRVHDRELHGLAYSPGGRTLATVGWDGLVKVWDLPHRQVGRSFSTGRDGAKKMLYRPDQQALLALYTGNVAKNRPGALELLNPRTGRGTKTVIRRTAGLNDCSYSFDGRWLAHDWGHDIRVVDAHTCEEIRLLSGHGSQITTVQFLPQSGLLVSGAQDGSLYVWDVELGQRERVLVHSIPTITTLATSDDGQWLAACSASGQIAVWNLVRPADTQPVQIINAHRGAIHSLMFRPGTTQFASAGDDGAIRVWHAPTGERRAELYGHVGPVQSVCYSPDGRRMVSGGVDGTATLWDADHDLEALTLRRQLKGISHLTFSPDGTTLLAVGYDVAQARFWFTQPQAEAERTLRETNWHEAEASGAEQCRCWAVAVQHLTWLIDAEPSHMPYLARRGYAYAELGRMDEARADYRRALQIPGASNRSLDYVNACTHYAALLLQQGDEVGYLEQCHRLVTQFHGSRDARVDSRVTEAIVRAYRFHQGDQIQIRPVMQLAERLIPVNLRDPSKLALRGMIYVRAGRSSDALDAFTKAAQYRFDSQRDGEVFDWLWLALAYAHAKYPAQACLKLQDAERWLDRYLDSNQTPPGMPAPLSWVQKLELTRLRREVDAALQVPERKLPPSELRTRAANDEVRYFTRRLALFGMNAADLQVRANCYAELNQWRAAADDYAALTKLPNAPQIAWYRWAIALVGADDMAGFRVAIRDYFQRYSDTKSPALASKLLYVVTMTPELPCDVDRWLELGELAKEAFAGNERLLGAVRYRAGAFAGALKAFDVAQPNYPRRAWDWYYIAMCQHRLGRSQEAQNCLRRAEDWFNDAERLRSEPSNAIGLRWFHWEERIEVFHIRREAEAMINPVKK